MQRLWNEEVAAGSSRLRLETLKSLGGAAAIVHGHLDDALAELDEPGQDAAAAALRYLVTSTGRTMAFSTAELSGFSEVPVTRLEPTIDLLERERILRPVAPAEPDGIAGHELFHDVLAPAVVDWRRRHAQKREREAAERALEEQRAEAALALEHEHERAVMLEAHNRRLAAAVIALVAMVAALVVYARDPDAVRRLELGTVDARFRLRPDTTPADVTLVAVRPPPQAPFTRRDYGDLVRAIDAARPRAIAVDVAFDATGVDEAQTRALLTAIDTVRTPVVFAYTAFGVRLTKQDKLALVPRTAPYNRKNGRLCAVPAHRVCFGYAGTPVDPDDGVRRVEGSTPTTDGGPPLVPLPVWVARLAGGRDLGASVRHGAARRAWHGQTEETMWIDYSGPAATIRTVRAADVLAGRAPRAALRGKVVVVGNTSGVEDVHKTPFGRRVPGADVQSAAIDTLLRGAPLRDVPFGVDVALILLLAMVAPAVLVLTGSAVRAALAAVAGAALFLLGAYLAFRAGRVVSVVVPLGALVVATAGVLARGPVIGLWSRLRGGRAGVAPR
jgi:CHASE2 domain-containing sensor protein